MKSDCFSREDTTVCRIVDKTTAPSSAFNQCFGDSRGAQAERIPMARVVAGDLVLSSPSEATRVVVAQHRADASATPMIVLEHEHGELVLTPDHVLKVDGKYVSARDAAVGAMLEPASKITKVYTAIRSPINLVTTNGKVLAAARTGAPVVASIYPDWIAPFMLSTSLYPLPYSFVSAASYLLPERAQTFFDQLLGDWWLANKAKFHSLETIARQYLGVYASSASVERLFSAVKLALLFGLDVGVTAWFAAWVVCSHEGLVALLALAAAVKACRSLKA